MSKIATSLLQAFIAVVLLVALYGALNAGSVLFAIQMATIVLWAALFLLWSFRRAKQP
jgi:low temperature requirement protein LtrA